MLRSSTVLLLLLSALILSGCGTQYVDVTAEFGATTDIQQGAPLYFNGRQVGKVGEVSMHEAGSVVGLQVDTEDALEISSSAVVVMNRIKPGAPLELHNPVGALEQSLQAGQTVTGLDSMVALMAWSVGDMISESGKELTAGIQEFQDYLKGDEFQRSKAEFQEQMKQAAGTAGAALKTIEQGVTHAVNEMVASEEEMAAAIDELSQELAPMVEEMSRSGSQLAMEIDEFMQRLEDAAPEDQQTGQRLLESLTRMLEELNRSMEKGANEGLDQSE